MKLSLVVPCYNEELTAPLFYQAVQKDFASADFDCEIIFVNDGSKDGTLAALKQLVGGSIPVTVINFSRNFGKEAAMYAGLKQASGDYVTVIDADLQQRPSIALDMVRMLDNEPEYDCIAAYQADRREGGTLSFFKKSFYRIINRFSDTEFVQGASDFRTFRRQMVDAIINMQEYYRFSKGLFSWVGFNTKYIPYTVEQRAAGTSSWSFIKLFKYAFDGIIAFTTVPLRLATGLGVVSVLASFVWLVAALVRRYALDILSVGKADVIIILLLLLAGLQLLCIGIVGEYLARTYVQSKGRPIYITKEIINGTEEKTEK